MATIHYMGVISGGNYFREIMPKLHIAAGYVLYLSLSRFADKLIMSHQLRANNISRGASRLLRSPTSTAEAMYNFETSYFADEITPKEFLDIPMPYSFGGFFDLGVMEEYFIANYIAEMNGCHIYRLEEIRVSPEKFISMLNTFGFKRDPEVVAEIVNEQMRIDKSMGIPRSGARVYPDFENRAALLTQILGKNFGYPCANSKTISVDTPDGKFTKAEFQVAMEFLLKFYLSKIPFFQTDQAVCNISRCFLQIFSHAHLLPRVELMLAWSLAYFHDAENANAARVFDIHFEKSSGFRKYFIAMLRATFDKRFVLMAQKLHHNYYLPNLTDLGRGRLEVDMLIRQQGIDRLCQAKGHSFL